MALNPGFPRSPYAVLDPAHRWFPAEEALRAGAYEQLLPPLVARIRSEVAAWRESGYAGASATSIALLRWWFETDHVQMRADGSAEPFRWYYAQREAVESVIWLYDVARARDKFDLLRFDASGAISANMFGEQWPRYVVKMATGAGKTKVLSLLIAWSYFHRLYEADSALARNVLLIAPNIIVLDRLRIDFDGLRIFFQDPVLPDNGFAGRDWRDDFQFDVHLQDDVRIVRPTGNLFLTNVHRIHLGDVADPTLDDDDLTDYFLQPFGPRPTRGTTDNRADLGELIREIDELAVFNDEAHHIHDERMAWFASIRDIHHRMLQKDRRLALQIDVTATPRHDNGAIFVQTVSDYPLVEAIHQRVGIHTTRKRLIGVQRQLQKEGKPFRAFEVLNLGRYERQAYLNVGGRLNESQKEAALAQKEREFRALILRAYKAEPLPEGAGSFFHGTHNGRLVVIGPINLPVGRLFVEEVITECRKRSATRVDLLAFEFEMGLFPAVLDEARAKGIELAPKQIPPEVFDKRAVERGQVVFHDMAFIEAAVRRDPKDRSTLQIELTDFSVYYTQGAMDAVIAALRDGKSQVVCDAGQLWKVAKSKQGVVSRERLTTAWTDWIDYWAVDFDYGSRKEIVKRPKGMAMPGSAVGPVPGERVEWEDVWTGAYVFENEWQSFRTRQDRSLELTSVAHTYARAGLVQVAVKVIDIFGNDTMTLVTVSVG